MANPVKRLFRTHPTEAWLAIVLAIMCFGLSVTTDTFFSVVNFFDLLNSSSVNLIFAVGLLVVLISGGIDISFAVAASVVQYIVVSLLLQMGGGNWAIGLVLAGLVGVALGAFNAFLIHSFKIISIVVTIATFNVYFGMLMFLTRGVSIYTLPDWLDARIILVEYQSTAGVWAEIRLPVLVMMIMVIATYALIRWVNLGRQLYAFGDNPDGARRFGINISAMHYLAYGWLGLCAGIAGLMQVNYAREVVPNAFYGRELDVLAAVVLGGARLGGGRGSVIGCVLGVALISVTENGLNLLGISPYAFKMIVGAIILIAITLSNAPLAALLPRRRNPDRDAVIHRGDNTPSGTAA